MDDSREYDKIDFTEISFSEDCNYYYNFNQNDNEYAYVNTINNFNIMTNQSLFSNTKYFILNKNDKLIEIDKSLI
jgi:hypothetical protein